MDRQKGKSAPAVSHAAPVPVEEYIAPAVPHVAPAPVVEYIAPAASSVTLAPVDEYSAPTPAVYAAPTPVVEYIFPSPVGYAAPAPVVEFIAPAPVGFAASAPVDKHISPVPPVNVASAPAPVFLLSPDASDKSAPEDTNTSSWVSLPVPIKTCTTKVSADAVGRACETPTVMQGRGLPAVSRDRGEGALPSGFARKPLDVGAHSGSSGASTALLVTCCVRASK